MLIEGEEYDLVKLGDTITLSKTGEDFTLMLDKEEEGEQPEPGVYEPEDASWLGTWTDGTHTLIVNEQWNWSLDSEMADKVWEYESGEIVLQFNGTGNSVTRYYLERSLIDGTDTVVVSSLTMGQDDYWHLVKEVAEPVTLPEEAVGEWVSDFAYAPTLVVNEDGSITLGGVTSTPEITDDGTGALSWELPHPDEPSMILTFVYTPSKDGNPATISYNNGNIVYTKKDETAPIVVPDVVIGTWTGEDFSGNQMTVVVSEDGTVTVNGEPASFEGEFVDDGTYIETDITYDGGTHSFQYVISSGEIYVGFFTLTKVEETEEPEPEPTIVLPEGIVGTWKSEDTGSVIVIGDDGSITIDGKPASFVSEFEEQHGSSFVADVEVGGKTDTLEFNAAFGSIYFGWDAYKKVEETEEPEPTPAIELPDGIVGTWKDASTGSTIVIGDDGSITIDGEEASFVGEFEEQYEGSFVVQVEVGGETKPLEFNSAFGSIYLNYGSYKKVEETEEPTQTTFPAELIGTWTGTDTFSGGSMTLIIAEDGTVTYNGTVATSVTAYNEDAGLFTFVINGDQFRATVQEDVISHKTTITLSCLGGATMVQGKLTKAA